MPPARLDLNTVRTEQHGADFHPVYRARPIRAAPSVMTMVENMPLSNPCSNPAVHAMRRGECMLTGFRSQQVTCQAQPRQSGGKSC